MIDNDKYRDPTAEEIDRICRENFREFAKTEIAEALINSVMLKQVVKLKQSPMMEEARLMSAIAKGMQVGIQLGRERMIKERANEDIQ